MPEDTSPAPLPAPEAGGTPQPNLSVVPPEPKRRTPSALNQAQQRRLQDCKQVVAAAKDPAHRPVLAGRGIADAFLTTLEGDIRTVEAHATSAVTCTDKKEGATLDEEEAKATLMTDLRVAQAAARQKYFHSDPTKLKDYFIGERIDANRPTLDQAAQGIVTQLNTDRPPGIDTDFVTKIETDRALWTQPNTAQGTAAGQAKTQRELRDARLESIARRSREIQFAADAAWPPRVAGNGGFRRQFRLPLDRPFVA